MMTEHESKLILDLALKKISEAEFIQRYSIDPRDDQSHIRNLLFRAKVEKNAVDVEYALMLGFLFGEELIPTDVVCDLVTESWHTKHEDMALLLQEKKEPSSVKALSEAALMSLEYLGHDESYGFARKCTWALADIGTVESKRALEKLSTNSNEHIAMYAKKRIDNWEQEKGRKGSAK
jgi:hypothetical protein